MMKRFALVALVAVSLFSVTACQKSEEGGTPATTETATESTTTGTETATGTMETQGTEATESAPTETAPATP